MLFRVVVASYLVMAGSAMADNAACKKLADGITITFPNGAPGIVQAGDTVKLPVKITVTDRQLLDPFEIVPITFYISNGQLGSLSYFEHLEIKKNDSGGTTYTEDFVVNVPFGSNSFGYYMAMANMTFFNEDSSYCAQKISKVPHDSIVVVNDHDKVDVHAPIVTAVASDKAAYQVGDSVTLLFAALDKSAICTDELIQSQKCKMVWHMTLVELGSAREVNVYPKITLGGSGKYKIVFELLVKNEHGESLFSPGKYKVIDLPQKNGVREHGSCGMSWPV